MAFRVECRKIRVSGVWSRTGKKFYGAGFTFRVDDLGYRGYVLW